MKEKKEIVIDEKKNFLTKEKVISFVIGILIGSLITSLVYCVVLRTHQPRMINEDRIQMQDRKLPNDQRKNKREYKHRYKESANDNTEENTTDSSTQSEN